MKSVPRAIAAKPRPHRVAEEPVQSAQVRKPLPDLKVFRSGGIRFPARGK